MTCLNWLQAYDREALRLRGKDAVTNFPASMYRLVVPSEEAVEEGAAAAAQTLPSGQPASVVAKRSLPAAAAPRHARQWQQSSTGPALQQGRPGSGGHKHDPGVTCNPGDEVGPMCISGSRSSDPSRMYVVIEPVAPG